MSQSFIPTIKTENVQPGMVLDFQNSVGVRSGETFLSLKDAEVISVESPDGLGDYFGIWASPEDGTPGEVYVQALPGETFKIVG